MKTLLLSIVLCLQLVLFPVTAAYAEETGQDYKKSAAAYAKAISSLAIGVTGAGALTGNKGTIVSPYIYGAGAIVMIAGDLILAKKYSDYQKTKSKELELKEDEMKDANGDYQKETIDARISMEKAELENIKKRETLHYALAVVMSAAMAMAIIEATPWGRGVFNGSCGEVNAALEKSIVKSITFSWSQAINMVVSGMSSAGGTGVSGWFSIVQSVLGIAASMMGNVFGVVCKEPVTRSIFFGASAGILYWVAADLSKKKGIAKDNITKLEDLLKKVKSTTDDSGVDPGLAGNYNDGTGDQLDPKMNIKNLPKAAETKSCLSLSNNTASFGNSACKNAVKLSPIDFKGGLNIPDLQSVAMSAVTAGNELAAGNWEGAEVALGDINSKAARIRDIAEEVQKKYNDQLKAQGKPTIDFKAEIAKQVAAIDGEVAKAMGMAPNSLAAAQPATISPEKSVKEESSKPVASAPVMPMDAPAMDLSGIGGGMESADVSGASESKSLDDSLNDYEIAENDIVKDPGVSIFKQVSNRYILNYNRFFNSAKKSLEVTPQADSKPAH